MDQTSDADDQKHEREPGESKRRLILWLCVSAAIASGWMAFGINNHALQAALRAAKAQAEALEVRAPSSISSYKIVPVVNRPASATLALGWPNPPQWLELALDLTETQFNAFQITIDKNGTGRLMQLRRVERDSNKEVRLALNSSAFGPGEYLLKIEGHTWRGETAPVGWVQLALQ